MIETVVFTLLSLVILINLLLLFFWFTKFKEYKTTPSLSKKVSVLVAARNEEEKIEGCIKSLIKQNYPKGNYEVLVGDDQSTDRTAEIIKRYPEIKLFTIIENIGKARGKANVLAQLASHASGDIFLITDADVRPNENWIKNMVAHIDSGVGMVNGVTFIENSIFQNYEWLFAQGMLKVISDIYCPVTAIGNNMLVTREAYESTGGYENIEFSITEDYALYSEVKKRGFSLRQVMHSGVLATTFAPGGLVKLLHQRKRWMQGAVKLPVPVVGVLGLQGIFFALFIIAIFIDPGTALILFLIKLMLQAFFIISISGKINLQLKGGLVLYEIYAGIVSTLTILFYLIPVKINWKERKY